MKCGILPAKNVRRYSKPKQQKDVVLIAGNIFSSNGPRLLNRRLNAREIRQVSVRED